MEKHLILDEKVHPGGRCGQVGQFLDDTEGIKSHLMCRIIVSLSKSYVMIL